MSDKLDLILESQQNIINILTKVDKKMNKSEQEIILLKVDMQKARVNIAYQWGFIILFGILFTVLFF